MVDNTNGNVFSFYVSCLSVSMPTQRLESLYSMTMKLLRIILTLGIVVYTHDIIKN